MSKERAVWDALISQAQDRFNDPVIEEDEMTTEDFLRTSGLQLTHDSAYKYLMRLVVEGKLTRRMVFIQGRKTSIFKPVKLS